MTAASLPDQPPTTTSPTAPCHGPYQQQPHETFIAPARRTTMLQAALDGVALGTWDTRILAWLCHWSDTPTFLAILGWIQRARTAAAAQHHQAASTLAAVRAELQQARRLCQQASAGPWARSDGGWGEYVLAGDRTPVWAREHTPNPADAELAAWAQSAIPRLLSLVDHPGEAAP